MSLTLSQFVNLYTGVISTNEITNMVLAFLTRFVPAAPSEENIIAHFIQQEQKFLCAVQSEAPNILALHSTDIITFKRDYDEWRKRADLDFTTRKVSQFVFNYRFEAPKKTDNKVDSEINMTTFMQAIEKLRSAAPQPSVMVNMTTGEEVPLQSE